jgi:hypothetical protein
MQTTQVKTKITQRLKHFIEEELMQNCSVLLPKCCQMKAEQNTITHLLKGHTKTKPHKAKH